MPSNICNANSLKIGIPSWTVVVQILQRFPPIMKSNRSKATHYQKFVLVDMEGTFISAIIYDNTIPLFDHLLHPYKRYKISNAHLKPVVKDFRISDYNYTWNLTNRTPVELIEDVHEDPIHMPFQLVPFSELYKHADKEVSINIMGLLVQKFAPIKNLYGTMRKLTILTQEKIPVTLTIWIKNGADCSAHINDTVILPICILATDLRVSTYDGVSLNSRMFTYLMVNPQMPEIANLLQWFNSAQNDRSLWQLDTMLKNPGRFFRVPPEDEVLLLQNALKNISTLHTAWVRGQLEYIEMPKGPCSVVCGHCNKSLDADPSYMMTCMSCKTKALTKLSLRLTFRLSDKFESIVVTTMSPLADSILSMTVEEIQYHYEQKSLQRKIEEAVKNCQYTCLMKVFYTTIRNQKCPHYSLLKFYAADKHDEPASTSNFATGSNSDYCLPTSASTPPGTPIFVSAENKTVGQSPISTTSTCKSLDFSDISTEQDKLTNLTESPKQKKAKVG